MWENYYKANLCTAEEAIQSIKSNQSIFLGSLCNEPQTLVEELVNQRERIQKANLFTMVQGSKCLFGSNECLPFFNIKTFLSSPKLEHAFQEGVCDYIPINISKIPEWLTLNRMDVVLIQISPPNEKGYCSLGVSVDFMKAAIQHGKHIIAEVNSEVPWTYGDTTIHVKEVHCFVTSKRPIMTIHQKALSDIERRIGENVAKLIPNGATIQIGVGNISESILLNLNKKKDLGVHTGTFTDGIIELIETGVITNKYKNLHQGKIVSTSISGTKKLYDYVHNNPLFELYPVNYTHNIRIISKIDNFHSINSAVEVDISGQINAENVGKYTFAGVGGQMDFIIGAQASVGGKSIIALPSTAKNDSISRITKKVVTATSLKSEIEYVVTEYGVASLFGKSLKERQEALIAIAHPKFRDELRGNQYCFSMKGV